MIINSKNMIKNHVTRLLQIFARQMLAGSRCFYKIGFLVGMIVAANLYSIPMMAQVTPTVGNTGAALSYVTFNQEVTVSSGLTITGTAITQVTGATVIISNAQAGDVLTFTPSGGITGSFNSGTNTLTLSGNTTSANYQNVLRTVKFKAGGGGNPSTAQRTITFNINFSATNPVGLGLYGTAVNAAGNGLIATKADDSRWTVQGPGMASPIPAQRDKHTAYNWPDATAAPWSAWVSTPNGIVEAAPGAFNYRLDVDFTNINPSSIVIKGRWSSDNQSEVILVGAHSTGQGGSIHTANPGGDFTLNFTNSQFPAGPTTLTFRVQNEGGNPPTDNPQGTHIQFTSVTATGSASGQRAINIAQVSATNSTVSVTPSSVTADGTSYSTVTVTVKDATSANITGLGLSVFSPELLVGGDPSATATFTDFTEVGNGTYTFRAKNTKAESGNVRMTVKGVQINQQPALTFVAGAASKLQFQQDPTDAVAGAAISPAVTVRIEDAQGNLTSSTADVSVALTSAGGATLGGTATVSAVGGVATFPGLTVDKVGSYTLTASSSGLTDDESSSFTISVGAADASNTTADVPNGTAGSVTTIVVTIQDAYGNVVSGIDTDELIVTIDGDNVGAVVSTVTDNGDGTYTVTYTPIKSGTDEVIITLGGDAISGSPYTSNILHSDLEKIILSGDNTNWASGTTRELTVTLYDEYDNIVDSGPQSTLNVSFVQLTGAGSVSGLGTQAAVDGIAQYTVSGEKGGDVFLLAAMTSPPLTSNLLSFTVTIDKSALQDAIDDANDLTEADWSPASWSALESALSDAQDVFADANATQSEVDAAEQALRDAIDNLAVDKSALQDAIDDANDLTEADWSPASWSALESALSDAQDVFADANATQSAVDAAEQALRNAIDNLAVDKSALQDAIDDANDLTEADWSPASWSALESALSDAQDVFADANATQSAVDAAEQALRNAIDNLAVDKSALQDAIDDANDLTENDWSPASWSALESALSDAQDVFADATATQSEVDAAEQALRDAIDNLAVDKSALQDAIDDANDLTENDWTSVSWSALEVALDDAQDVFADANATQSEIDTAEEALREAIANLMSSDVGSVLQTLVNLINELNEDDYTSGSWGDMLEALVNAQAALSAMPQVQSDLEAALDLLEPTYQALVYIGNLRAAVKSATAIEPFEAEYTVASWTAFEVELQMARELLADPRATPELVEQVTVSLIDAQAKLIRIQHSNAPTGLHAEPGDKEVALTWIAPTETEGSGITSYEIQYSIDNGVTWETFGNVPSSTTQTVVGGLENNRPYVFRVAAINESGTSPYSNISNLVIPTVPMPEDTGELPQPPPGGTVVMEDGKIMEISLTVVENQYIRLSGQDFYMDLYSLNVNGQYITIWDIDAVIRILRGDGGQVQIKGHGFEPGTVISVYLFSTPQLLGQIPVDENGDFDGTLEIPNNLEVGNHTIQANGIVRGVTGERSVSVGVLVVDYLDQQITFEPQEEVVYGTTDIVLDATSNSGLPVSYRITDEQGNETQLARIVDGNRLRIEGAGTVRIIASQEGGESYNPAADVVRTLVIKRATQQIQFVDPGSFKLSDGQAILNVSTTSGLPVQLKIDDQNVARLEGNVLHILRVGTVVVTAEQPGNDNYLPADPVLVTIDIVDEGYLPLRVHKAVSPNGDGINEFLMIEGINKYPENRVTIFNKNGVIVFENQGYDSVERVFRGISSQGARLPAGTYYYILEIKDNGVWKNEKGFFVMRY